MIGIYAAGYLYYTKQRELVRRTAVEELQAIAELKMREIFNWREERLADARIFYGNSFFSNVVREFLGNPADITTQKSVREWMLHLKENHDYRSIRLLDTQGSSRLKDPEGAEDVDEQARHAALEALHQNEIIFSDLRKNITLNVVYIDVYIPVIASPASGAVPLGVLVARIDARNSLFPFIEHWPTPSPTSETFLVRRDGNDVLYLNDLRHRKDTALTFRMPISTPDLPASRAVAGETGIVEGIDYRGAPVLAYIQQIPHSAWALIAKVDVTEVFAPIRERTRFLVIVVITLTLGAAMGVGFLWRIQQAEFYRKQFEAGLERQALTKHFEYLTKYANDILSLADAEGNIIETNDRALTSFGYTRDEMLGMNIRALRLPEDRAETEVILKQLDRQDGLVYETVMKRKDGSTFPVETSARTFYINDKKFYQAIHRDITERKRAEQTLTLFSSAVEQTGDAVMITNKEGVIEYVNPSFEDLAGYKREEAVGQTPRILKSGKHGRIFYENMWKTITSGGVFRGVMTNKKKNGELYHEEETITPILNAQGNIAHFVSTARDITERIRIQENLARRQDTLQSVYEMAITPGSSFQAICDLAVLNLSRLLGLSHVMVQRVIGGEIRVVSTMSVGQISHEETDFPVTPLSASVLEGGVSYQFKGSLRELFPGNPYLSRFDLESFVVVPIRDKAGMIIGIINGMDFDARTLSGDEIQLIEIFASYIGHEIERNLLQVQLQKAQEMKILGQLASGVAHEVRNPLSAILSIMQAIDQELGDNPDFKVHLSHIRSQVNRLSQLMQDLLELGKPIPAASFQPTSMSEVCTTAVDLWGQSSHAGTHKVRVFDSHEDGKWSVFANSDKLVQIFINLFDNAAQHSPMGSEIQLTMSKSGGSGFRVAIRDQGSGVPPENLKRILEPFFTTRKGGTGLGLSIVKHIVELHGGELSIWNNTPPPGCTVEINLPAIQDEQI